MSDACEFPLSRNQRGIWWDWQSEPGRVLYNTASAFRVRSALDSEALRRAFQHVIDRHGSFRSSVSRHHGGELGQRRRAPWPAPFFVHDASDLDESALGAAARAQHEAPCDLARGTGVELHLFRRRVDDALVLLRFHHLFHDHGSTDTLHGELFEAYAAERTGQAPLWRPLPHRYEEFVAAEHERLEGSRLDLSLAFWRARLERPTEHHDLPADLAPVTVSRAGATLTCALTGRDVVVAFARARGVSLFRVLLAAYVALLHRYSGAEDIVVGTPTDGRGDAFAGVGGNFVNLLPFRFQVRGAATFDELVKHVDDVVRTSLEHRLVPFPVLVEHFWRGPPPPLTPFCRTTFALTKARRCPALDRPQMSTHQPWSRLVAGLRLSDPPPLPQQEGHFHLSLWTWDLLDQGLALEVKYDPQLFSVVAATRLARHYQSLLLDLISGSDRPISTPELLDDTEREQVRRALSGPRVLEPFEPADAAFVRAAKDNRTAVAVEYGAARMTYEELDQHAGRVAAALQARQVRPGALVAIVLPKGPHAIAAMLGVLRAGAAFVPVDPAYPADRVALMLDDASPCAVLTNAALARLVGASVPILDVSSLPASHAQPTPVLCEATSLAYVIYTSGSTGRPKGVLIPHRGIANLARALVADWSLGPGDRVFAFAPLSFDACIADIFPALMAGATVHLGEDPLPAAGHYLADFLMRARITHVTLPPSVWLSLPTCDLPDLRVGISAGEPCPSEVVRRFAPSRVFFNNYGPTECTVCATTKRVAPGERPTLGRPIRGVEARVLDGALREVPIGVTGELYLGGLGLGDGYLGRPELTAERFLAAPDGTRLYRTGDMVRVLANGELDYVGRTDSQVKLRGFRIELGEVEDAMRALDGVRDAAVAVQRVGTRDVLVGFAVGAVHDVLVRLRGRLPKHLIPSRIVAVAELPRTPSGKVDRPRLPAPDATPDVVPPATETERTVVDVFRSVLGHDMLGATCDFFMVGGDSLSAVQALAAIDERRRTRLSPDVLVRHPSARELSRYLDEPANAAEGIAVELAAGPQGTARLFILVHPAGGELVAYRHLASLLAKHGRVLGLRAATFAGVREPASVEAMADLYAEAVERTVSGPFALVGWSFGGVIAHALARRLAGRVQGLFLLDSASMFPHHLAIPLGGNASILRAHAALYLAHRPLVTDVPTFVVWADRSAARLGSWAGLCMLRSETGLPTTHEDLLCAPFVDEVARLLVEARASC